MPSSSTPTKDEQDCHPTSRTHVIYLMGLAQHTIYAASFGHDHNTSLARQHHRAGTPPPSPPPHTIDTITEPSSPRAASTQWFSLRSSCIAANTAMVTTSRHHTTCTHEPSLKGLPGTRWSTGEPGAAGHARATPPGGGYTRARAAIHGISQLPPREGGNPHRGKGPAANHCRPGFMAVTFLAQGCEDVNNNNSLVENFMFLFHGGGK